MTKYYAYHEPGEEGDVQVILSVKAIVKERVQISERYSTAYRTAADAVEEWAIINWAYPCTRKGEPLLTPNLEHK